GGYRPNAGRPKGQKNLSKADRTSASQMPLDYMLAVMRDKTADVSRRDRMAIAAAPYVHKRTDLVGKKEAAQQAAETAGEATDWADLLKPGPVTIRPATGRKAN
ncbi:MAG TPA: hypothetical protein VFP43_14090, partial [Mesorhizobium sp.]|nr:hypothetical protein [Mesorhizobium sp.]